MTIKTLSGPAHPKPERRVDQSVQRALALLKYLFGCPQGSAFGACVTAVHLPPPTVHRLLKTLVLEGFVIHDPSRHWYAIHPAIFASLDAFQRSEDQRWSSAAPILRRVRDQLGHTVHLAVWDRQRGDVRTLFREEGTGVLRVALEADDDRAYCTATGRVLLAYLDESTRAHYFGTQTLVARTPYTVVDPEILRQLLTQVAAKGWATESNESHDGVTCVGVPVRSTATSLVVAALSVSFPSAETTMVVGHSLEVLQDAAQKLGQQYDHQSRPAQGENGSQRQEATRP